MIPVPENPEAERSTLATLCAPGAEHAAAVLVPTLCDRDFLVPSHRAVFMALRSLVAEGEEVNSLTLRARLTVQGAINLVGDITGLHSILEAEEVGRPEVLIRYLQTARKQRELQAIGYRILKTAADTDPVEVVAEASASLSAMAQTSGQGNIEPVANFSDDALAEMLDKVEGRSVRGTRLHGWPRFNGLTHGLQPGQLIVLAARPGIGKSALAMNWLLRAGMNGKRAAFFSLEMPKEELWNRLVADKAGVDTRKMIETQDREAFSLFAQGKMEVDDLPLHVSDRAKITVPEICAQVDRIIGRHGKLDLLVVDYLQLLTSVASVKGQSETVRIGDITRSLKLLAKDRHVPVLLLSQLNREVEKRQAGKPQLSDLRDSGCIEQDADMVIFIHRNMTQTNTDLIIAKHRSGPCMTLPLSFKPEITRYIELERDERETAPLTTANAQNNWNEYMGDFA